jgi:sugar phosphate permease
LNATSALYRRVGWRVLPILFVSYIFNYLDRVNIGFAKLAMLADLRMSETAYGLGAGIFFLGYIAFGVPSNIMLQKVGARRWLAAIMIFWGILSSALMVVRTPNEFFILRSATGAAEAGFFPGIVLYLTRWFPLARRGRVMTSFMVAIPLSGVIGGPLSGWMLSHFAQGQLGLFAWQWLFLLQGLPTIALSFVLLAILEDRPESANWLSVAERRVLIEALAVDHRSEPLAVTQRSSEVLKSPILWALGAIYFCAQSGVYAINFWLPTVIKDSSLASNGIVGWLTALPYLAASLFMLAAGRSADAANERRWHLAFPMLLGAFGLVLTVATMGHPTWSLFGLSLAAAGAITALPMFWPIGTRALGTSAAAIGVGLINSMGQIAGFVSPYLVGWIKDQTRDANLALLALSVLLIIGAAMVLLLPRGLTRADQ